MLEHQDSWRWDVRTKLTILVWAVVLTLAFAGSAKCCVGRVLTVAVTNSPDQLIMGKVLSLLINERTGTTVELLKTTDLKASQDTVLNEKANMFINYIGFGMQVSGNGTETVDSQRAYTLVRQHYLDNFQMVWLKPFGYQGPVSLEIPTNPAVTSMAAPVTTKEVLRKFPVLDRVINKLAGKINDKILADLTEKSKTQDVEDVARDFLKSQKLI